MSEIERAIEVVEGYIKAVEQRMQSDQVSEKKEYIERGAFIDFIDAGHLRYATEKVFSENDLVKMISEQPAADVEPVVRCKDCRFFNVCLVRQLANIADDGFCSLGDGALAEKGDAT